MLLRLDGHGPRYAQITRALTAAIQDGRLPVGARLPSSRALAADLGCARNVVLIAYEQLLLEGYLATRTGGGTFVALDLARRHARGPAPPRATRPATLSEPGRRLDAAATRGRRALVRPAGVSIDFMYGLCEPDARTVVALRSAFAATLRARTYAYGSPAGDHGLRQAVATRLLGARGIPRNPDRLVVTSGAQQAADLCARLLINPGDRVVMEEPGYGNARAVFEAAGATIVGVPVDEHGLDVGALPADRHRVRVVYVTPSHQFPTGAVLPIGRRYALLEWARRRHAYIIEDDYDGEFRYTGRPIEALAALDSDGPVIYCGTFAKALFPSLRLAFLSLPPELASAARHAKWIADNGSSLLLQRTVAHLMDTGEYDRHIRRMTRQYRARRDALVQSLRRHFGDDALVEGAGAGLHVVVWLPRLSPSLVPPLIAACHQQNVGVYPVAPRPTALSRRAGLLLGFGLVEPRAIETGIAVLAEAYREIIAPKAATLAQRRGTPMRNT
jgi:GntR family transcriptional regulator/MocR family aminotransferase